MNQILIAYFSRDGENYLAGALKYLKKGNTEIVAEMIHDLTGGDLFKIETVQPYPSAYSACVQQAVKERQENARPELKKCPETLDGYEIIFVGYPNWCGTMPMPVFSFLERYTLAGKRILPFCTNEGSGLGFSEQDLQKLCPSAFVEKGLAVCGGEAAESRAKVEAWLRRSAL